MEAMIRTEVVGTGHPDSIHIVTETVVTDRAFDFEEIIPIPSDVDRGAIVGPDPFRRYLQPWIRERWGCELVRDSTYEVSAVSEKESRLTASFRTTWGHPWPILHALACRVPDVRFEVRYSDEQTFDTGGHYHLRGQYVHQVPIMNPYEFGAQLVHGMSYAEFLAQEE